MPDTSDPHQVLGLRHNPPPTRGEVKAAFRSLALRYHPDLNRSAEGAQRYEAIQRAAQQLLGQGVAHPIPAGAGGAGHEWARTHNFTRHPRFPLYFSAACLVGGCLLFAGALHVHQDLYTYSIHKEVEERRQHPSEAQRHIMERLREQQEHRRMEQQQQGQQQLPP